jgi:hypothetical protein
MTIREQWNAFGAELEGLRSHDASPERVERIRARCLAALAARRRTTQARQVARPASRGWIEPAFAFGLGAFYLAAAIGTTLQLAEVIRRAHALLR